MSFHQVFSWYLVFFLFKNIESIPIKKFGNNSKKLEQIGGSSSQLITKAQSLISNLDFENPHEEDANQIHAILDNIEQRIKDSLEDTSNFYATESKRYGDERDASNADADKITQDAHDAHEDAKQEEQTAKDFALAKESDLDDAIVTSNDLKDTATTTYDNNIRDLTSQSSEDYYSHCFQYQLVQNMRNLLEKLLNSEHEEEVWDFYQCQDCLSERTKCTQAHFETESPTSSPTNPPTMSPTEITDELLKFEEVTAGQGANYAAALDKATGWGKSADMILFGSNGGLIGHNWNRLVVKFRFADAVTLSGIRTDQPKFPETCEVLSSMNGQDWTSFGVFNGDGSTQDITLTSTKATYALFDCPNTRGANGFHAQFIGSPGACVSDDGPGDLLWRRVYMIENGDRGSTGAPLDTNHRGDIYSTIGSSFAKLSDQEINAIAAAYDGYTHIYKMCSSDTENCLFIKTNNPYQDNVRSFNVGTSCKLGLSKSYDTVPTWADPPGGNHGIDLLYSSPAIGGERCERYFLGHGALDCWGGHANQRCVNGGSSCSSYKKLSNLVMYVLSATCG